MSSPSPRYRPLPPDGAPQLQRVDVIFETVFETFLVVDHQRRFLRINAPAIEMLGAPAEAILGSRIDDFTAPEHHPLMESLWAELVREGRLTGGYEILRGDGKRSVVDFRARSDFDAGQYLIVARPAAPDQQSALLTPREREVLQLAADGRTLRDIAEQLFVAEQTVKTHFENIHAKLGVRSRAAAVAAALRCGLIE
jgi:PAS domain S-box-containing protein